MESKTYENGKEVSRTEGTEQQSSIEVSCNAKGEKAWKVKVYGDDPLAIKPKLEHYIVLAKHMMG